MYEHNFFVWHGSQPFSLHFYIFNCWSILICVMCTSGILNIWNLDIWNPWHLETWTSRNLDICKSGHLKIWKPGTLNIWTSGNLDIWDSGILDTSCNPWHLKFWTPNHLDFWTSTYTYMFIYPVLLKVFLLKVVGLYSRECDKWTLCLIVSFWLFILFSRMDDIIVGAPMYANFESSDAYDTGRVYIYYQASNVSYFVTHGCFF